MLGFGWLAAKLALTKVGPRMAKPLAGVIIFVAIAIAVGLLYWFIASRIDNYGDRRYNEGIATERKAWEDAKVKLEEQARQSATQADDRALQRLEEHKEQIDADRKAVDQAVHDGTSPLDALFGG